MQPDDAKFLFPNGVRFHMSNYCQETYEKALVLQLPG